MSGRKASKLGTPCPKANDLSCRPVTCSLTNHAAYVFGLEGAREPGRRKYDYRTLCPKQPPDPWPWIVTKPSSDLINGPMSAKARYKLAGIMLAYAAVGI